MWLESEIIVLLKGKNEVNFTNKQTLTTLWDVREGATIVLKVKVDAVAPVVLFHLSKVVQKRQVFFWVLQILHRLMQ